LLENLFTIGDQWVRNYLYKLLVKMVLKRKFKAFDDSILDLHQDLKEFLKPNDNYPELERILMNKCANLPTGSLATKVIINKGKVVERVFKTPKGNNISLFSGPSNIDFDQVA
tara:strand:+ start:128 stop:466 length:339 start_codon:yes stop_codon:yes gene_type:complete